MTYDNERKTATKRGYDWRWKKVRDMKLQQDPLCERCEKKGRITVAVLVHHKKLVSTHKELRLVIDNLESLCVACHEAEHKEDRRYGKNMQKS